MPLKRPMFDEELKVPRRASIAANTIPTMMLKSTKYQYSLRLDLPLNTAYFLNASRYQLIPNPPYPQRSLPARCDRRILSRGGNAHIHQRGDLWRTSKNIPAIQSGEYER